MKKLFVFVAILLSSKINAQWSVLGSSFQSITPTGQINSLLLHKKTGYLYATGNLYSPISQDNSLFKFSSNQWSVALNSNNLNPNINLSFSYPVNDMCQDSAGNIFLASENSIGVSGGGPVFAYYPIILFNGITGDISGYSYGTSQCATAPIKSIISIAKPGYNYFIYTAGDFINQYYKNTIAYSSQYGNFGSECGAHEIWGIDSTQNLTKLCASKQNELIGTGRIKNSLGYYIVAKGYGGLYWDELGGLNTSKFNNEILALGVNKYNNSNDIYAVGKFTNLSGKRYVATWDGTSWTELGGNNSLAANGDIYSISFDAANNVYVAGDFTNNSGKRYVAKWDGISWTELGGYNNLKSNNTILKVLSDSAGNVYAAGKFTDTANNLYVAKYSITPVPLKLLSFTAKKESNHVLLNWQTASEVNVSYINVQRSINSRDFIHAGKVNASCCAYTFIDDLLSADYDKLYYRLEIVDINGSKTYSGIKNIDLKQTATNNIHVYPNPAKDFVSIECNGVKELMIIDNLGRTVYQKMVNGPSNTISTSQFPKGLYVIKLILNNLYVKTEKLLIN